MYMYINKCSSHSVPSLTGCEPDAAVCLHTAEGGWHSIGMASTQEIIETGERIVETALFTFTMYVMCTYTCTMYVAGTIWETTTPL